MTDNDKPLNTAAGEDEQATLKGLWNGSKYFKIAAIAGASLALAFLITLIVLVAISASNSSTIDSLNNDLSKAKTDNTNKQGEIDSLNIQLKNASNLIKTQADTIVTLTNTTQQLAKQLNDTNVELNKTKTYMKYWQIGTGVGGGLTLATGGYSIYETSAAKYYINQFNICSASLTAALKENGELKTKLSLRDSEIASLKTTIAQRDQTISDLNTQVTQLTADLDTTKATLKTKLEYIIYLEGKIVDLNKKIGDLQAQVDDLTSKKKICDDDRNLLISRLVTPTMDNAADGYAANTALKKITRVACFDSAKDGGFNRDTFIDKCATGKTGSTYIVFTLSTTNKFGIFIKADLPTDTTSAISDPDAFVSLYPRGYQTTIKSANKAFSFTSSFFMNIGDSEIILTNSGTATSTISITEGNGFDLGGEHYCDAKTTCDVTSLVAYKIQLS